MINIEIPGKPTCTLVHLLLDFNGTLAFDGALLPGVAERLTTLACRLEIHVVTGDTYGSARVQLRDIPCALATLPAERQAEAKLAYLELLDPATTVCIGNGRNDRLMLQAAALGIAVLEREGAASAAVQAADVMARNILEALDLLANPLRLTATLRT